MLHGFPHGVPYGVTLNLLTAPGNGPYESFLLDVIWKNVTHLIQYLSLHPALASPSILHVQLGSEMSTRKSAH